MKTLNAFFRQFKEESIMIPLLMVIIEAARQFLMHNFPEMGTFIPEAELFIFGVKLWQMLWITSGVWLVYRIVFPAPCKDLIDTNNFYSSKFNNIEETRRSYFSLSIFIALLFGFVMLFNGANGANREENLRKSLCDTLNKQLYVREATGNNDGFEVERYLKSVGAKKGQSWCAAYVSYNYNAYNISNPSSAWSPTFANPKYKVKKTDAQPGDAFTLFYTNLNRVGHVGFITGVTHGYFKTNEGNTGGSGVREGDGVHSYLRKMATIYQVNNYITNNNEKTSNNINAVRTLPNKLPNITQFAKREQGSKGNTKGFDISKYKYHSKRFYNQDNWRQLINPFRIATGWNIGSSTGGNKKYATIIKKTGQHYNSRVLLQGFGSESKAIRYKSYRVQGVEQLFERKTKGNETKNYTSAIHTNVCQMVNWGWNTCNFGSNSIYTKKISNDITIAGGRPILARNLIGYGRNIGIC